MKKNTETKTANNTNNQSVQTQDEKIRSIEQTVNKNEVRTEISEQIVQFFKHTKAPYLSSCTLPAADWYFETMLQTRLRMSTPELPIEMHGVEACKKTYIKAVRNMPEHCEIHRNYFHNYFQESGITFNFMWADYCGNVNSQTLMHSIKHIENIIQTSKKGMYYVTFCNNVRKKGGPMGCKKDTCSHAKPDDDLHDAIVTEFLYQIKKRKLKSVHMVYDVVYAGGSAKAKGMVTLVFSIGIGKNVIPLIQENRMESRRKLNSKRYQESLKRDYREGVMIGTLSKEYREEIRIKQVEKNRREREKAIAMRMKEKDLKGKKSRVGRIPMTKSQRIRAAIDRGMDNEEIFKYLKYTFRDLTLRSVATYRTRYEHADSWAK